MDPPTEGAAMTWLLIAIAGGLGAACRYLLDALVTARTPGLLPWGTLLVNLSGSLAAGVVAGLATVHMLPADVHLVVAGGFLGAYTTFSTAMYETFRLWEQGARPLSLVNLLAPLLLAIAAAALGWQLVI